MAAWSIPCRRMVSTISDRSPVINVQGARLCDRRIVPLRHVRGRWQCSADHSRGRRDGRARSRRHRGRRSEHRRPAAAPPSARFMDRVGGTGARVVLLLDEPVDPLADYTQRTAIFGRTPESLFGAIRRRAHRPLVDGLGGTVPVCDYRRRRRRRPSAKPCGGCSHMRTEGVDGGRARVTRRRPGTVMSTDGDSRTERPASAPRAGRSSAARPRSDRRSPGSAP